MANNTVKVDMRGLTQYEGVINVRSGPIRDAFKQWAVRYRAQIQRRFISMSKGGWPKLKRARKRGSLGSAAVLRDTGLLLNALEPTFTGKPGALQKNLRSGVRVGYGGPHRHKGGKATIADIASYHQRGKGRLPTREIIVPPDGKTLGLMAADMERALIKLDRATDVV